MVTRIVTVKCPTCGSESVSKNGRNKTGKQVYNCNNHDCERRNFVEEYTHNGFDPKIRKKILDMTANGTGTHATGRILGISKDTVTSVLKKRKIGLGM